MGGAVSLNPDIVITGRFAPLPIMKYRSRIDAGDTTQPRRYSKRVASRLGTKMTAVKKSKLSKHPREWVQGLKRCFRRQEQFAADVQPEDRTSMEGKPPENSRSMEVKPLGISRLKKIPRCELTIRRPKYKTVVKNGPVPLEENSQSLSTHRVKSDGEMAYAYLLTRVDIASNRNDFIIAHLLEPLQSTVDRPYVTQYTSGRIGEVGSTERVLSNTEQEAVTTFKLRFEEKVGGSWTSRDLLDARDRHGDEFAYIPWGYPSEVVNQNGSTTAPRTVLVHSRLDKRVQQLAKLIFPRISPAPMSVDAPMLHELKYDVNKLPLGPLSLKTLDVARDVLYEIDRLLKDFATLKDDASLQLLSSDYYTLIPHAFSANKAPPIIDHKVKVQRELQLLAGLRVTIPGLRYTERRHSPDELHLEPLRKHRLDELVDELGLSVLQPLQQGSKEYRGVEKACIDTKGNHQMGYSVIDIFRVERKGEAERFKDFKVQLDNRVLLWHGSTLSKFQSILSQGLRTPTVSEKPHGDTYGRGIYLANVSYNSAQYCRVYSGPGLLLLCEVQLGDVLTLDGHDLRADSTAAKQGKSSSRGVGNTAPKESVDAAELLGREELRGVKVYVGKLVDHGKKDYYVRYDEFVAFSAAQVRIRYIVSIQLKT